MLAQYLEFTAKGVVEVKTEEVSAEGLGPMEALIRNETSIISAGTELARLNALEEGLTFPVRPGYGSVGRIEALGEGISDYKVGDRVFYAGKHASLQRFTHGENHQWGYLFPVPEGLDAVDAAVGCMAEIAETAPEVTELSLNDTVAVFGLGLVGNLAAQMYALRGARVIGVDPVKARCDLAQTVGIQEVLDVPPEEQVAAVKEATGGEGAHVCVDATGVSPVVLSCVQATRLFGQVVLLGSPRAPYEVNVTETLMAIHRNGLVVRGAHMWRYPVTEDRNVRRTVKWMLATAYELMLAGKLHVHELVSHVVGPDDAPAAYEGLQNRRDEYTGVVIDWR
jgi:2-desacetyl-2-hydroxyethyl bacteriochlorophyllide A dehydrogenase